MQPALGGHLKRLITGVAASAVLLATPRDAQACGGLFCSSTPVDQTAEHILFTVNPDVTATAIIQISYTGDKDNFAWIVPVPGAPKLSTDFPQLAFQSLDSATQPQYQTNSCAQSLVAGAADAGAAQDSGSVTVLSRQVVGPYDTVTLEGTSSDVIVKWLQDNQYRVTDKMIPILEPYVADGMKFVALRLTPDAGVSDITPLTMTYPGTQPMIPIRLTAVAAQPEMGIVVWVLADRRYGPDAPYKDLKIPDSLIKFDQYGSQNNYLTLVSTEADKVGGEAFVTEYSQSTGGLLNTIQTSFLPPSSVSPDATAARDALTTLLQKFSHITRLYTRISPEEMLSDPRFKIAEDQSDVSNIHDLTDPNFDYTKCQAAPPPSPCEFTYCGRRGACTLTTASATGTSTIACACAADATAQSTGTSGQTAIYCEPIAMNFDVPSADSGAAMTVPACEAYDCGVHGECVGMNGNPTCRCDAGYGATVNISYDQTTSAYVTQVSCEAIGTAPALPRVPLPGETTLPPLPPSSGGSSGCDVARTRPDSRGLAWLLAGLGATMLVRRRRH